ncbi:PREDICTED: gibberellin 2-beta-dioxygenase 2 [Ipomoea nil]|uniref:gibberellin 2-beta-dioxygenase 2 n=1 Tax=Ipomoea nil TaxID=35883 RepID=UPI000901E505|nr:PREDICTED: gibberellin 2-beta-dioxygenase 2 [Ipomoea nil]
MVVSCPTPPTTATRRSCGGSIISSKKTRSHGIPTIDLLSSEDRASLSDQVVKACEEVGIFKVVNHGVSDKTVASMEMEALSFFSKPAAEKKRRAGPANPFGYGCNTIGFNGDKGQLEYILLEANPDSKTISDHYSLNFSCVVRDYIDAVRNVACEVLELAAEGLRVQDKWVFSRMLRDSQSDSCFRVNHYPHASSSSFGEHTDPQILTVLRSNDVDGLQIRTRDGLWVPVPADPKHMFVMVGDAFQALTNGRFRSVRHRVVGSCSLSLQPRTSMMYFGAPALNEAISPLLLSPPHTHLLYKSFTWGEYKQAVYSLRLANNRLSLFNNHL